MRESLNVSLCDGQFYHRCTSLVWGSERGRDWGRLEEGLLCISPGDGRPLAAGFPLQFTVRMRVLLFSTFNCIHRCHEM